MQKNTFSLFISLISLIISIFYFLSFHAFRNSNLIYYDNEKLLFSKRNAFLCDNITDFRTCKPFVTSSNLLRIDDNDIFLDKNTMICDNVLDESTCECINKNCDFFKNIPNVLFIDKPIAFSDEKFGKIYGSRIIPKGLMNEFSFSTWINISFINSEKWRSIFQWVSRNDPNFVSPGIYISPEKWSTCNAKIDIRFSKLDEIKQNSIETNGMFNTFESHGHCVSDTKYYEWFHFTFVCKYNTISYYINGDLSNLQSIGQEKIFEIGNEDGYIYIGGSKNYSSEGIILAKTRWYSKALNESEILFISKEKYE